MRRLVMGLVASLVLGFGWASSDAARAEDGLVPLARPMPAGRAVAPAPPGFVSFCLRFPGQCVTNLSEPKRLVLTADGWERIEAINSAVNRAIRPLDDLEHYGRADYWNIPTDGEGDCEDYALTKRKLLIAAGLAARALRIAVVTAPDGERHAVLTIATDHGDYVLDNLAGTVRSWDNTGYRWIERQDPDQAWGWVALGPSRALVTASTGGHG